MEIFLIAGFLGAGKTTLLLALAEEFVRRGRRVAVIENDAGRFSVDAPILRNAGLRVREIRSGCVCCTLRGELAAALGEIEREVAPDVLLVEPSGIAGPGQVLDAIRGDGGTDRAAKVVYVIDAFRFLGFKRFIPFLEQSLKEADFLALSKIDLVDARGLEIVRKRIGDFRPGLKVYELSNRGPEGFRTLALALEEAPRGTAEEKDVTRPAPGTGLFVPTSGLEPQVHSDRKKVDFPRPLRPEDLAGPLAEEVERRARELRGTGCELLGHVKVFAGFPDAESPSAGLSLSLTSFDLPPEVIRTGETGAFVRGEFVLNAIAYGGENKLRSLFAGIFDAVPEAGGK